MGEKALDWERDQFNKGVAKIAKAIDDLRPGDFVELRLP